MKAIDPNGMFDGQPDPNNPNQQQPPLDGAAADGGSSAGDLVSGVGDGISAAIDGASIADALGCLDGCASCSVALFVGLFLTAGAAFAMFK